MGIYSFLKVLQHYFKEDPFDIVLLTDTLFSTGLLFPTVVTSIKLLSNSRLQREQMRRLSETFPAGDVRCTWIPSQANLSDVLTKVPLDPVQILNSSQYREGLIKEEPYLNIHQRICNRNTFYLVRNGVETFSKLEDRDLEWCNLYNQSMVKSQQKKRQKRIIR